MSVYVTLKCDGTMPPGSRERCRAGFSVQADRVDLPWGGDGIELLVVTEEAEHHGWSQEFDSATSERHQFCPSCTRHRREG